jgi:hypothetical protein
MELMSRYLLLFDSYGLVFVGRPLWREAGSVFCTCCWPLPAQSFLGPSPLELATIFYCLRFETSFSSPPTTRRVTVEVFDPASTLVETLMITILFKQINAYWKNCLLYLFFTTYKRHRSLFRLCLLTPFFTVLWFRPRIGLYCSM